jgi:hypothetical protein
MQRWTEEVQLLQEEMRRVLAFCEYHASWWDKRVSLRGGDIFDDLRDGIRAYAAKQASIQRSRAKEFAKLWASTATAIEADPLSDAECGPGGDASDDDE